MTPAEVRELLENELIDAYDPDIIKDLLECRDVLRNLGSDSLFYNDADTVIALVKWKRGLSGL